MRERLLEACPALPQPVVDKMLAMDAGELDLILQHPSATQKKVGRHKMMAFW